MKDEVSQFMGKGKAKAVELALAGHLQSIIDVAIDVESGKIGEDGGIRAKLVIETVKWDDVEPQL